MTHKRHYQLPMVKVTTMNHYQPLDELLSPRVAVPRFRGRPRIQRNPRCQSTTRRTAHEDWAVKWRHQAGRMGNGTGEHEHSGLNQHKLVGGLEQPSIFVCFPSYWDFLKNPNWRTHIFPNMGDPKICEFISWKIPLKWMMTGGSPVTQESSIWDLRRLLIWRSLECFPASGQ